VVVVYWYIGLSLIIFGRNLLNKEAYKPLPMGDGQKYLYDFSTFSKPIVFRFQNHGLTKKPVQFSSSISCKQFLNNFNQR
jgi:outer membrane protein insertion porin family